ncbi:MAG TPA: hypothetical protein VEA38_26185 [Terriglobales bacterium]|nr:hypothetical protein [Terriglobales bacterium]
MADLAASDVTVTIQTGKPHNPRIEGTKRKSFCSFTFGDGALTYPSGGVPLPTYEKWGLVRNLEYLELVDSDDASALMAKYDAANHKLRLYHGGVELIDGVDAPAAMTFYGVAVGW